MQPDQTITRRLCPSFFLSAVSCLLICGTAAVIAEDAVSIGSRRELFVDRLLIGEMKNTALKLHEPALAESLKAQARPDGAYATVLQTQDKFQFYYRRDKDPKITWKTHGIEAYHDGEATLYAESKDAISWTLPKLDLFAHPSFPEGNVVLMNEFLVNHNFTPFVDTKPGVPADQKYKALGGIAFQTHQSAVRDKRGPGGLKAFVSPDGIHWKKLREEPVIPEAWGKYFDSQNYAFWSESEQCYVCYFRRFIGGMRGIARTTSQNFITWTPYVEMKANLPDEHLYTPCTQPYFRAPHIYLALPTRFMANRGAATDILFMSTRGGGSYDREFTQSFIRPGLNKDGWANRANYAAIGIHQTSDTELSMFLTNGRRYRLRLDGFVSVNAPLADGELLTKALTFDGNELTINYATSAAGQVLVELQDANGNAIPGFTLADCDPIYGDHIARTVTWKKAAAVGNMKGKVIKLRFVMSDADLFSLKFD